jgi:hypothetical protein
LLVNHESKPRAVDEGAPAAEVRGVNVHAKRSSDSAQDGAEHNVAGSETKAGGFGS